MLSGHEGHVMLPSEGDNLIGNFNTHIYVYRRNAKVTTADLVSCYCSVIFSYFNA
jgi:hypothetical protein